MITVTPEEINQFRSQLTDYPERLAALDTIEECEGYLDDAITLLIMRETAQEPDKGLSDWLGNCGKFICQEEVREALESGIIAPAIEAIAIGASFPPGVATALSICVFKLGTKKFCQVPESDT